MTQFFQIHPGNPQPRLVSQAVAVIRAGGLIAYPTDSCYALGCQIGDKTAMERIRRIRQLDAKHDFTLVCRDLSEISTYAKVDNVSYRLINGFTPGPYTFILSATHEVPRRLLNPKRKTIGLRVPDSLVARTLLEALGEPLMSSTLTLPPDDQPLTDADEIRASLAGQVDLIIDGGNCGYEPTSVIDLSGEVPVVRRRGRGDVSAFE